MDAFDADVLIYAAAPKHPLGERVRALFSDESIVENTPSRVGSVLLLPELLTKPSRANAQEELDALAALIARIELRPVDEATATLGIALGAKYGLRAADAVHLATAVAAGADRFITNNSSDFTKEIEEVTITYPDELPEVPSNL